MLIRDERLLTDELNMQLHYDSPITSTGAVMTLPAASADLKDWITDDRRFVSQQHDDWMQVMGDFSASVKATGPKLARRVEPMTMQIESLLPRLISPTDTEPITSPTASFLRKFLPRSVSNRIAQPIDSLLHDVAPHGLPAEETHQYTISADVQAHISQLLDQLDTALATDDAIIDTWHDLRTSADNIKRTGEDVAFRRDTLCAIAQRRKLNVLGPFGVFADLSRLVNDSADAIQEELDREAGRDHFPSVNQEPSGDPLWRRLQLCENVLTREPHRGDCVIWLRLEPASVPQNEVTHGQVTFYNAAFLSSAIGDPGVANRFKVPPSELLNLPPKVAADLRAGDDAWESDWRMAYARVELPGVEVHAAEARAGALVEALIAVNHAEQNTWRLMNGSILFVDGDASSLLSWGPKENEPDMYYPGNDRLAHDVELMAPNNRTLDAESLHKLQDAVLISTTLKIAEQESPQATVMAAVRAIEHANTWTTGGKKDWPDFASHYFKKAPSEIEKFIGHHEMYNRRVAADHVAELHRIYSEHWLRRGLGELERTLATPAGMAENLEEQGRAFDRQLGRLKRLRNSALHGGPISDAGCESVSGFALALGHRCLNEAMKALLTGSDIPSHMDEYREDSLARYDLIQQTGDIDAFFVDAVIEVP